MLCLNSVGLLLDIIDEYEATITPETRLWSPQLLDECRNVAEDEDDEVLPVDEDDDPDEDNDDFDDEWDEAGDEEEEDEEDKHEEDDSPEAP